MIRSVCGAVLAGAIGGVGVTFMQWLLPHLTNQSPARQFILSAIFLAFFLVPLYWCVIELPPPRSVVRQANASQDPQRQWFARVTMGMFRYVAIAAATYAVLSMVVLKQWPEFH